nr:DUF4878 domain-containing protein [Mycobacterium lepraemurium]
MAGIAVLVTVGIVMAIVMMTGNRADPKRVGNGNAGDVVMAYLEALAKGDADTALGLAAGKPGSNEFLTKEMLKQQIDHWPIKNIAILDDSSKVEPGDFAIVKAAADFGENHSEGQLQVKKSDGVWGMVSSAINISGLAQGPQGDGAATLTLFDKPLREGQHAYVFPGYLAIKSVRYVDVGVKPVLLESLLGDNPALIDVGFSINDARPRGGRRSAEDVAERMPHRTGSILQVPKDVAGYPNQLHNRANSRTHRFQRTDRKLDAHDSERADHWNRALQRHGPNP